MSDICPDCLKKDFAAQLTERDHKDELKEAAAKAEALKSQLAEAVKRPADADTEGHPKPSEALFEEWMGCTNCRPGLMAYREKVAADVVGSPDFFKRYAEVQTVASPSGAPSLSRSG